MECLGSGLAVRIGDLESTEAPNPGGELVRVHSYLMRSALSTSLPVQLTRDSICPTQTSQLYCSTDSSTPPLMTGDGWMDG